MKNNKIFEKYKIKNYDDVEIRFDKSTNMFSCNFQGEQFLSESVRELKDLIHDKAKEVESIVWEPIIEIYISHGSYDEPIAGFSFKPRLQGKKNFPSGEITFYLSDIKREMYEDYDLANPDFWKPSDQMFEFYPAAFNRSKLVKYTYELYLKLCAIEKLFSDARDQVIAIMKSDDMESILLAQKTLQLVDLTDKEEN